MKTNHPHEWTITLVGKKRPQSSEKKTPPMKILSFIGRLDEALAEADVQESNVCFTVVEFRVIRGKRVKRAEE